MGPRPTIIPKVIPEKKHRTRPVGTIDVKARRVSGSGTVAGGLVLADNAIGTRAIDTMTDATAKRVKLLLSASPIAYWPPNVAATAMTM